MKILHIASGDLWAGAEKQLYTLLLALRQSQQCEVSAALLNPGTLADKLQAAGIAVKVLDERQQNMVQLVREVDQWTSREKPDVIHTHRLKENIIGALVSARQRIPCVRTQHGANEHAFSAFNLRKKIIHGLDYLAARMMQKKIIAVSEPLAVQLRSTYGSDRVCVIDNGLDLDEASPTPENKFQHPLKIGIVGRLMPVKRVDLFLHAAQLVLQSQPADTLPEFKVVGDGPLRAELEVLVADLGIADQVRFVGHVDNAEPLIAQLDVLVICSDHEGLPMVALEAMKHRTLVLTHRIGGLPRLLGDGQFGYLAERHDAESFAGAINDIISKKDAIAARAQLAQQQLTANYSAQAMAQRHIELYRQIAV
jgi:glycosyltransferase involved in cell wall biosynthesis